MSRGIGGHQSHAAGTTTWLTPPEILAALGPFDLDPCAAPLPRPWPSAKQHIVLTQDGLSVDWGDQFVWCNPPYGRETWSWLHRLADHAPGGIALVFAHTETEGFVSSVWERATSLFFLYGRLHFHHADGARARMNSGGPSVLVAYGPTADQRLRACALPGRYVAIHRISA